MQEGIIQIGKIVSQGEELIETMIQDIPSVKQDRQMYILKYCFDTVQGTLRLDTAEMVSQESTRKYRYIGKSSGGNSSQWYAAVKNSDYHLSETIPNLCEKDFGEALNQKLDFIKQYFFVDLGDEFTNNKNRYALDFQKIPGCSFDIQKVNEEYKLKSLPERKKVLKNALRQQLKKCIEEGGTIKFKDIALSLIEIDGKVLSTTEQYAKKVLKEKHSSLKKKKTAEGTHCFYCGTEDKLTSDINLGIIKTYTMNLCGFASNADKKNYEKNMVLCQDCLNAYLAGETYIKNNLSMTLANCQLYMYPHFILGEPLDKIRLEKRCEEVKFDFNTIKNFKSLTYFQSKMDRVVKKKRPKSYYLLNFVFYKNVHAGIKVQKFIQDVHPSRFEQIEQGLEEINMEYNRYFFKDKIRTFLNLNLIFYLFAVRENKKRDLTQFRWILDLYEAILTGRKLSEKELISKMVKAQGVLRYEKEGFNIKKNEKDSVQAEFQGMQHTALLKFLRLIGNMKGENAMDVGRLSVDENIKQYIQKAGYTEEQTALFFLGCVVANVGVAQYKNTSSKPIYKKLNFNGMDPEKVRKLAETLQAKVFQEKLFGDNEKYLAYFTQFYICKKTLSSEENLFYILSGYNFITLDVITNTNKNTKTVEGVKDNG
ncbi:TM1802 family CRISPR-associated protein [Anaerostipes sp.]|uniref:TM1802 family CRISPR-associated protein n=1 Tax=Anaerostipes sp. TaxID=1872530 RepID=UPI0025BF19B2|nr:TM1802 family CRISPR-associated protein [Anaerostipes sp.]MBS7006811.1 hypothetical protein [Anaerostipes sp.]